MTKRLLSLLLVLVMVLSVAPMQVFAMEKDVAGQEILGEQYTETVDTYSDAAAQMQSEIDSIVAQYGVTADMTDHEVANQIFVMDGESLYATMMQIDDLTLRAEGLTEEEFATLDTDAFGRLVGVLELLTTPMMLTTVVPLDGQVSVTDSANTGTYSNGTYTATAKGSLFAKKTNTITITNESSEQAKISFEYNASSASSFTINGVAAANSGSFSQILDAGTSITISLVSNSGLSNTTATLTMTNIAFSAAQAESLVTFVYDADLGSVSVDGEVVENNTVKGVDLETGVSLIATAEKNVSFLGWINAADGSLISSDAAFTYNPSEDIAIRAAFAADGGVAWFSVGGKSQKSVSSGLLGLGKLNYHTLGVSYLYDNLTDAVQAAAASPTAKSITLMNTGVLPAGDYTIPAGVDLLIPFDKENSMYTTQAVGMEITSKTYVDPNPYRILGMESGANLTINGTMSLSAKHKYAQGSRDGGGSPYGDVSFVVMSEDSSIVVNNGGALYVYGFITGSGSITAYSGATVYENFQIMDFRGGTQSTDMENGVFPLSQYYIQNIEVPLTLYSGAREYSYTTIYMSSADFGSAVGFIGPNNSMFNLTSGYVTKRYDGATDRLFIEAYGDMTVSPISMSVGTSDIDSADYELPINNNLTVTIDNGTFKLGQDIAMLPGAKIIVGEDATIKLEKNVNIYIYDLDEWGNFTFGKNSYNSPIKPLAYAPGRTYTRTAEELEDATIVIKGNCDASLGNVYTTAGGAAVVAAEGGRALVKPGTQTVTYQLVQGSKGPTGETLSTTGYVEIPLTSAMLKNGDGTYVSTDLTGGTYTYTNGVWVKECVHELVEGETNAPTCTEPGGTTYYCKDTVNCGYSTTDEIPAKGHNYSEDVTDPTCEAAGYTTYTCDCGDSYVDDEVDALGHDYKETVSDPDCVNGGYTTYTCDVCGHSYVDDEVDALGHTEGEAVKENEVAASCGADGSYDSVVYCSVCGIEMTRKAVKVPATGDHNYATETERVEATCTVDGYYVMACVCGATETTTLTAQGHDYDEDVTAPTCTAEGYTTYTCSVCGDTYVSDKVNALGHTEGEAVVENEVAADCVNTGSYDTATYCTVCGAETSRVTTTVDALGHDYEAVVTAPTCTEAGYTTYTCSVCGDTYTADEVNALGHTAAEAVKENEVAASCGADGSYESVVYCSVCGAEMTRKAVKVPATGDHNYATETERVEATCTVDGYYVMACVCGATETTTLTAQGHDYDEDITAPTCTAEGYTTYTCACGDTYVSDKVSALGHTEGEAVKENEVDPDCEKEGSYDTVTYCTVCEAEMSRKSTTVNALGHNYDEGVVTDPTYESQGYTTYTCGNCGHSYVGNYVDALVPAPTPAYKFATSMSVALELEAEVFMVVSATMTNEDGSAIADPAALADGLGLLFWDAAEVPADTDATVENCDNVMLGATYNASTKKFDITSKGIAAKALGDNLAFRPYYTDGNGNYIYGRLVTSYSPKKYCYSMISKNTAKEVCVALLNYGAAAQTYFNYNTENLMNADLTDAQKAWTFDSSLVRTDWSAPKGAGYVRNSSIVNSRGASLELEGAINVVFTGGTKNITVAKAEIMFWSQADYDAVDALTDDNATKVEEMTLRADGKYEYVYEKIPAKKMFEAIYSCMKFTDVNGNVYYGGVVPYCAERYTSTNQNNANANLATLAKAMVVYGDAARAYFK